MSEKPAWAIGYGLKGCGVPCAEEIAMMLGTRKPYGYNYGGTILPKPKWDEETYPNAIMRAYNSVWLYVSAAPLTFGYSSEKEYVYVNPPYCVYSYERETDSWEKTKEVSEGASATLSPSTFMWSNQTVSDENGIVRVEATNHQPFYLNETNTMAALLYDNGKLVFQSNSVPEKGRTVVGAYVGWDTAHYADYTNVPWVSLLLDRKAIKSVIINEDVVPVYTDYWFYDCENLTSATLHGGLKEIGNYMFYKTKLSAYNIPEGITRIGDYAYAHCEGEIGDFKAVTIPATVKYIGAWAFDNNDYIKSVTIPGVEEIGRWAFGWMDRLAKIHVPETTKRICPYAFADSGHSATANITDITFAVTDGWWVSEDPDATEGIAVTVSTDGEENQKLIGTYVVGNTSYHGTYTKYYWNRSE